MTAITTVQPTTPPVEPDVTGPIRPFERDDIPQVADLFVRAYFGKDDPASPDLREYFYRVFFTDPWCDLHVTPSLVFVDDDDIVRGFLGAHPRRFICRDRVITAVALGQLMVEPRLQRRGIAWNLGSAICAGPQVLTYGTTASAPAVNMWRRLGFWNPPFAGLKWSIATRRGRSLSVSAGLKSMVRFMTAGLAQHRRSPSVPLDVDLRCRPLRSADELAHLHRTGLTGHTFRPDLDAEHTVWLRRMAADSRCNRTVHARVFCDSFDTPLGWVVYTRSTDAIARVLELAHAPGRCHQVLPAFVRHAAQTNCREVRGHCASPELTRYASAAGARLSVVESGYVFHTDDTDVRAAFADGQAFLSEMHSESWLDFTNR